MFTEEEDTKFSDQYRIGQPTHYYTHVQIDNKGQGYTYLAKVCIFSQLIQIYGKICCNILVYLIIVLFPYIVSILHFALI